MLITMSAAGRVAGRLGCSFFPGIRGSGRLEEPGRTPAADALRSASVCIEFLGLVRSGVKGCDKRSDGGPTRVARVRIDYVGT